MKGTNCRLSLKSPQTTSCLSLQLLPIFPVPLPPSLIPPNIVCFPHPSLNLSFQPSPWGLFCSHLLSTFSLVFCVLFQEVRSEGQRFPSLSAGVLCHCVTLGTLTCRLLGGVGDGGGAPEASILPPEMHTENWAQCLSLNGL